MVCFRVVVRWCAFTWRQFFFRQMAMRIKSDILLDQCLSVHLSARPSGQVGSCDNSVTRTEIVFAFPEGLEEA